MATEQLTRTDPVLAPTDGGDHDRFAHIIRKRDEMPGYIEGATVTALCGKSWVPCRDPEDFPICPTCKERLAALRAG